jgi:hypothetical protein
LEHSSLTLLHFAIINLGAFVAAAGGIFLKRLSDQLDHASPLIVPNSALDIPFKVYGAHEATTAIISCLYLYDFALDDASW